MIIFVVSISTLLFIGGAFPYGFPLFAPSVLTLFFLFVFIKNKIFFDKSNLFYLLLLAIYLLPISFFGTLYPKNLFDIIDGLVVFIFFIIFQNTTVNRQQFNQYTKYLQNGIFFSSFIFAGLGLVKMFFLLQGTKISVLYHSGGEYPWGSSLVADYNIFGLCLISGLISGYYILKRQISFAYYVSFSLMSLIIFSALLFSSSRRTWFVLFILLLVSSGIFLKNAVIKFFLFLSTLKFNRTKLLKINAMGIALVFIIFGIVKFLPEDISIKHPHQLTRIKNRFVNIKNISGSQSNLASRSERYEYAFHLINEYSILHLIFGNGSNYLRNFGQKFSGSGYDYPHNAILATVLQSGLVGALLVLGYICYCFFLYLRHFRFKETRFYFLIMLISSFYYFFSGNSIFSSKIYIFFTLLMPFAISRIYKSKH